MDSMERREDERRNAQIARTNGNLHDRSQLNLPGDVFAANVRVIEGELRFWSLLRAGSGHFLGSPMRMVGASRGCVCTTGWRFARRRAIRRTARTPTAGLSYLIWPLLNCPAPRLPLRSLIRSPHFPARRGSPERTRNKGWKGWGKKGQIANEESKQRRWIRPERRGNKMSRQRERQGVGGRGEGGQRGIKREKRGEIATLQVPSESR